MNDKPITLEDAREMADWDARHMGRRWYGETWGVYSDGETFGDMRVILARTTDLLKRNMELEARVAALEEQLRQHSTR